MQNFLNEICNLKICLSMELNSYIELHRIVIHAKMFNESIFIILNLTS
jgi:hypothetical protein